MRLKQLVYSLVIFCSVSSGFAQSNDAYKAQLPEILPASPEPTAFVKAGVGNANMSTGAANASIPLYTIQMRDFKFPVSLSYSTTGLKADEACSRVGLGWVLNASAMITRSVKGKPDEYAARLNIPTDFTSNADSLYNYLTDACNPSVGGDTQADEFQFNCNGTSGKFVLDNNYVPRVTATANVKINVQINVTPGSTSGYIGLITITTPDGVKYTFGGYSEKTTDHTIGFNNPYKSVTKTAFFLDRIDLPTGENILFNYTPIAMRVQTGTTQTLQIARIAGNINCGTCGDRNSYSTKTDVVYYSSYYLNNITVSNGITINLTYEARPDLSYDNRLKTLEVVGLKKYLFEYYDVPEPVAGVNSITGRFFLTRVRDVKLTSTADQDSYLDYDLAYNNLGSVPMPITFKQDYLGYYKANGSNWFIPTAYNNAAGTGMDFSFRSPNTNSAMIGALTQIKYPTGGTEEFIYEANTRSEIVQVNTWETSEFLGASGGGSNGTYTYSTTTFPSFTPPFDQTIVLTLTTHDPNTNDTYTATDNQVTAILNVYIGTTLVASTSKLGYGTTTLSVPMLASNSYKIELKANGYIVMANCDMTLNTSPFPVYDTVNVVIPGIRLKQLKYTDPLASSTYSKYYTYGSMEYPEMSSGGEYYSVNYQTNTNVVTYCGEFGAFTTDCNMEIYSSNSSNEVYNYASSGSVIYYKTVIESDDPNFANGGTEYTFFDNDDGGNLLTMLGNEIPYLATGQHPTLSGQVMKVRTFNGNKQVVQEELNEFETLIYMDNSTTSVQVRKRYEPYITRLDRMQAFDAIKSQYGEWWIRQKSKTVTQYAAGQQLVQKTDYTYGNKVNIQPASLVTTDSKGVQLKTEYKYPTEVLAENPESGLLTAANSLLVAKNIVAPAIQQTSYRNSQLIQQKRIKYKDWFGNGTIVTPEIIQIKASPADILQDELVYTDFDVKGNPLRVKKNNDVGMVYLWDQSHSLPTCQVSNAEVSQVAFSSFETGTDYGNWSYTSGAISANSSDIFTGTHGFSGTLSKSISLAGTYKVRLWAKGSVTVNGLAGTALRTARGWTYYGWSLTNPTNITVVGTQVDDVALSPLTSLMETFTYIPFVGVSSRSDVNGQVFYNEYDARLRLVRTRDVDFNITKQFGYKYQIDYMNTGN